MNFKLKSSKSDLSLPKFKSDLSLPKSKSDFKLDDFSYFSFEESDTISVKMNKFYKYVYKQHCQCETECIKITGFSTSQSVDCKRILLPEINENYTNSIKNIIQLFSEQNIISFRTTKYYMHINENDKPVKLSWENIKKITNIALKEKFWLFRKAIVDCIIKDILFTIKNELDIKYVNENIKVYSVGSSKLSSDYDITVYSEPKIAVHIITRFQEIFKDIFTIDSSTVFDTNIYGKGFITFIKENIDTSLYQKYTCKNDIIYYIKEDSVYGDSQLMWSLVKYISNIRDSFGDDIFNVIYNFMYRKLSVNKHLSVARKIFDYLRNKELDYETVLKDEEVFIKNDILYIEQFSNQVKLTDTQKKLLSLTDFISMVNFFGTETYYTRGAFLDTVINNQMCASTPNNKLPELSELIQLNDIDYITSIIENCGFFFLHNDSTKYFNRVISSLENITQIKKYHIKELIDILNSLIKIKDKFGFNDINYCNIIDSDDNINLFNCKKYTIFNVLFKLVYTLLKVYSDDKINNNVFIPFEIFTTGKNIEI